MDIWVSASTGLKDNSFSPYVDYSTEGKGLNPYSPNSSGYNYGLYDTAQPSCGTFLNNLHQFQRAQEQGNNINYPIPAAIIDKTGQMHRVPYYSTCNSATTQSTNAYQSLVQNSKYPVNHYC